ERTDSLRYFGAVTVFFVLGGAGAAELGPRGRAAAAAGVLFAAAACGVLDYNLWRDAPGRSTRDLAGAWIDSAVPAGSEVGMLRLPQPSNSAYFLWSRYRLRFIRPDLFARLPAAAPAPEWLVLVHADRDDREAAGPTLGRYRLVRRFSPLEPPGLGLPLGQGYGDPTVEIYKRKTPS
ncbi:MAG: hypothetical protein KGL53_16475, partial [Elusimicrobia bacterium]|nr:hypothetical protein [Elusimicrobiota bacterium]